MAGKTLVAYASRGGATEEAALEIANVLKTNKISVDTANLRKDKVDDLSGYSNIVAGAGVRAGSIYKEFWKLLEKDVSKKRLALFIVCGDAADPDKHGPAREKHLKTILSRHPNLRPVEFEVFGGRMKLLGRVLFDGRDPEKTRAWAEKLVKELK